MLGIRRVVAFHIGGLRTVRDRMDAAIPDFCPFLVIQNILEIMDETLPITVAIGNNVEAGLVTVQILREGGLRPKNKKEGDSRNDGLMGRLPFIKTAKEVDIAKVLGLYLGLKSGKEGDGR